MKQYLSAIFLAYALALSPGALAQVCSGSNVISNPATFEWTPAGSGDNAHFVGMLEIREAVDLAVGNDTITTRVYGEPGKDDSIPGPTLVMEPGQKYVVQFRNRLPYEPKSPEHNVFKDPNVSNLHTHGLHISGESPSDDVTRSFEGTAGGDFVYDIPADHMGGTFWYHAHHHGSTFLQVSAGAFGLIIIDDGNDGIPPNVAAMEERHLVVAYLDPDVAGTGGDTLITGSLSPTWTVNGKVQGDLCVPPDTWQHWRVLVADRDAKEKTVAIGSQCEMALLARDGVWRTEAPKVITTNSLSLTGASRADIAVRCSGNTTLTVGGQPVANIVVNGTANNPGAHPWAANGEDPWSAFRPGYLADLRTASPSNFETVNMGARTINGSKFDIDDPTFVLAANGVQDWTLKGARNHPFHLHVYHVQVQGDCGAFEDGEYYDVISGNCNIRFDLAPATSTPYDGRTIMHCHILEHEDQGAMGWADVIGGQPAPTFPAGFGYDDYIEPDPGGNPPIAPSGLAATTVSSSEIALTWTDNSDDETTFDIHRALSGQSFSMIGFVSANVTSFDDTGLAANTTYEYRVQATNADDVSSDFSNVASATTDPAGTPTEVTVGSITVSTVGEGQGQKRGRAVVVVVDDQGNLIEGALVSGAFSGTFNDVVTDADPSLPDGSVTIDTADTAKGKVTLEFCVTAITAPSQSGLADFSAAYGDACGTL